jgi:fatty acid-binding protein DegV
MLEEKFINLRGNITMTEIGNIIGSHCGPGTVAVSFLGNEREN